LWKAAIIQTASLLEPYVQHFAYGVPIPVAEITRFVVEAAPFLLQGDAPPDLFLRVYVAGHLLSESDQVRNTIGPTWDPVTPSFFLLGDDLLTIEIVDRDIALHDSVGAVSFSAGFLRYYAGHGAFSHGSYGAIYRLSLAVEPLN